MNVLFTSVTFKNIAGSELVTKDQAEWFLEQGFDVDLYTLEGADPMLSVIDRRVRIIDPSCEEKLSKSYSVIISRQWPVLEYLIFSKSIDAERIYYEAVSWKLPINFYPYFYKHLTLCGYVSNRVKSVLDHNGYDTKDSYYFPNNALRIFYDNEVTNKGIVHTCIPTKIAVVSNHPPKEIIKLSEIVNASKEASVEIYGMHNNYQLITPSILKKYDLVISVGKTVYSALAMGIPCYLYDETCTRGYITEENFDYNHANNMASSEQYEKKDSITIINEINSGFINAKKSAVSIRAIVGKNLLFENMMTSFYNTLMSKPCMDMFSLRESFPLSVALSPTYVNEVYFSKGEIMRWYNESIRLGKLTIEAWNKNDVMAEKLTVLESEYNQIINSKSWQMIKKIRSALSVFR